MVNTDDLMKVLDQLAATQKQQAEILKTITQKAPSSSSTYTPLHGQGGIFAASGLEPEIISTMVRPSPGIMEILPLHGTVYTNPLFGALTGITDDEGTEPDTPCDDAPTGYTKSCMLTAQFGRIIRMTQTIDINDVMVRKHRGDFTDLRLYGELLSSVSPDVSAQDMLNIVTKAEMVNAVVRLERELSRHIWQGTPTNNNGTGYMEFPGLDVQIATGQKDALTGTQCPGLDSDIKDFNWGDIYTSDIVGYVSAMEYYIQRLAESTGVAPLEAVWVMRPQLFFELSSVWPCQYMTRRCVTVDGSNAGSNPVVINDNVNNQMRWQMWNNRMLPVNGTDYRVVLDTGIYEYNSENSGNLNPGEFASSIYFVPIRMAGLNVTYREYVDFRSAAADMNIVNSAGPHFWPTDNGQFMWAAEFKNYCYNLRVKTEQRVVLRAPHLAGKIQHVKYTPLQHEREFDPDSPYYFDGGISLRNTDTFHAVWK